MEKNNALISLGFKYRTGDNTHTMSLSEHFHLEVDKGKLYILANEEESVTGIVYTELTTEMIEKVNATVKILEETK